MRARLFHRGAQAALLAALAAVAASCSLVLGIGDPGLDPTGAGGSTASSSSSGSTGGATSTASSTASATASGTGGMLPACYPTDPSCNIVKSDCLSLIDNSKLDDFALRIGQIDFYKPDAFQGTFEKAAFLASVTMSLPKCNLKGSGTFSWIVALNTTANTFRVGASKPPMDPHDGYTFVNETIMVNGAPFNIAPISGNVTFGANGKVDTDTVDSIIFPVYLDANGANLLLIPMHKVHVHDTTLSTDHNCIGSYNAQGLKLSDGCQPNPATDTPAFIDGGKLDGYVLLEEADQVIITSFGLNRTLCVLLSGAPSVFGDGGSPAKCKRDGNGNIKFPGDWCSKTNQAFDPSCYDAMLISSGFAASGVKLNP
jgi:hypothetical protein